MNFMEIARARQSCRAYDEARAVEPEKITAMLEAGLTPEDILGQVCGDLGVVFMETTEVTYKCYCSRDRVTAALISLGKKELEEIAAEGKEFPVECQFCDEIFRFTPDDIMEILKNV